jgi:nitrogen fixation protein NifX
MQIGGPAAAKLVALKIHPMKTGSEVSLKETVERFQEVLRGNPPPWLRKAMNKGNVTSFLDE